MSIADSPTFFARFSFHLFVPLVEVKWKLHGRQVNRGADVMGGV
jgi:hypothetical protein